MSFRNPAASLRKRQAFIGSNYKQLSTNHYSRMSRVSGGHGACWTNCLMLHQLDHHCLLRVQPALGLLENHRTRRIDDSLGDFVPEGSRQAVHENLVWQGAADQAGVGL